MYSKRIALLLFFVLPVIVACSSVPLGEVRGPVCMQSNSSFATNIISQTIVNRKYEVNGVSQVSPIFDLSRQDISELNDDLYQYNLIKEQLIDGFSFNTDAIDDISNGKLSSWVKSVHVASKPRFFVALYKSDFQTREEATQYMIDKIGNAYKNTTLHFFPDSQVFNVKGMPNNHDAPFYHGIMRWKGEEYPIGLIINGQMVSMMRAGKTNLLSEDIIPNGINSYFDDVYLYGFDLDSFSDNNFIISTPSPIPLNLILKKYGMPYISYSDYMKEFTSNLPKGFFVYVPPHPVYRLNSRVYYNSIVTIPAVYTQGAEYMFNQVEGLD